MTNEPAPFLSRSKFATLEIPGHDVFVTSINPFSDEFARAATEPYRHRGCNAFGRLRPLSGKADCGRVVRCRSGYFSRWAPGIARRGQMAPQARRSLRRSTDA